jgi:hypothetical protein
MLSCRSRIGFSLGIFLVSTWLSHSVSSFVAPAGIYRHPTSSLQEPCWVLHAQKKNNNNNQKQKGVYVRPSGAIERGSGFFVPGLEGPRVRLVFGGVLLMLSAINHVVNGALPTLSLEEIIAVVYSLLVLFQAIIEFSKEDLGLVVESRSGNTNKEGTKTSSSSSSSSREDFTQQWMPKGVVDPSEDWKSRVQWAAATYLALTPATHMMLLEPGALVYRLGTTTSSSAAPSDPSMVETGANAALQALNKSTSGRIALPATHPVVATLVPETHNRTVVLQRIGHGNQRCWLMVSDQLLASFTQQELKWLGQLARYVE